MNLATIAFIISKDFNFEITLVEDGFKLINYGKMVYINLVKVNDHQFYLQQFTETEVSPKTYLVYSDAILSEIAVINIFIEFLDQLQNWTLKKILEIRTRY